MTVARALKISAGAVANRADADSFPFFTLGYFLQNLTGNITLSAADSQHNFFRFTGISATVTLTRAPSAGTVIFVDNQGVNTTIKFSTGASVTIPESDFGIIAGDGTNARLILLGPFLII